MNAPFRVPSDSRRDTPQGDHATPHVDVTCKRPSRRYWPTTPLDREQAIRAVLDAERQDEAVLAIFRRCPDKARSPSQVHAIGLDLGRRWLLTSVRRSMTNLTEDGVLQRLDALRPGPHGKPEHLWQLQAVAVAA